MKFDVWIYNKKHGEITEEIVITDNELQNNRIKWNKKINELTGEYKTMANSLKRTINEKFYLVTENDEKIITTNKELIKEYLLKENKNSFGYDLFSGKRGFVVAKDGYFENLFNHVFMYTI